ncbi:MAG TPA: amino acid kinase [Candidatus Bathyarchaeia archaeon]|nr:amino acid kinase [Candidatus Bathyarchaeia archaeon]
MTVIIKLGGSLLAKGRELVHFLSDYAVKNALSFVIIPGGGPFADEIKKLSARRAISDDTAHWMAVLAMHQYGLFLADGELEIPLVENLEELRDAEHICIVLPYKILKDGDCLPHTWDVTSDTIAAFIARKLGEKTFIKVTDVDGILDEEGFLIKRIDAKELIEQEHKGCVDAELPRFLLQNKMNCVIVNGNVPERILDVIEGKETRGTELVSNSEK